MGPGYHAKLAVEHAQAALELAIDGRFPTLERVNREMAEFYKNKAQRAQQRREE